VNVAGTSPDDAICKGDTGAPLLRSRNGTPELVAVSSRSWQGGCFGETETRTDAVAARAESVNLRSTAFRLSYGNSVATGALTWLSRSINFQGNNHVVSGCSYVEIIATGADGSSHRATSSKFCAAGDRPFGPQTIDLSTINGGATNVQVTYWVSSDGGTTYAPTRATTCTHDGCDALPAPVTEFRLAFGNSVAEGALTWLNHYVNFQGNNHVASGCSYVEIIATGADGSSHRATSSKFCVTGDHPFGPQTIDLSTVPGGATNVQATYWVSSDGGTTYTPRRATTCTHDGCSAA
jgi:uncharacterized protein YfiM (DUF2279 family)